MDELKSGEITRDEYFEWKINWPQTCDGCGKYKLNIPVSVSKKQWRSAKSELSETQQNLNSMHFSSLAKEKAL